MRVLVTGGAGYVGSHICRALAASGHEAVVFDSLELGHAEAVVGFPLVRGNLLDEAALGAALKDGIDAVVHCAAYALVPESVAHPDRYYRNNVLGSLGLLLAMSKAGVRRLVFSSSCSVYGSARVTPIPEEHPIAPESPYGRTKAVMEWMMADWAAHGLCAVALRYFNAAGASPEAGIGEDHDPETHLVPRAILFALGKLPGKLRVFGTDYDTPDGTAIRDYVHVEDLARAHVLALERLGERAREGAFEAFNLGTGRGSSVREVLEAVRRVAGTVAQAEDAPRRPGDPPRLVADPTRAERVLGWKASRSDIGTIVADAWTWHRTHPGGYGGTIEPGGSGEK